MTVAALASSINYIENGVTLGFAAPFRFLPGSIAVSRVLADGTVVDLVAGVDFSTSGGTTDAGGTVTLVASVAGAKLRIRRATSRSQAMDYTPGDRFPAESHEAALDRAMLIDQEQDDKILDTALRALLVPDGETAGTLPSKASLIGKFLSLDVLGNWFGSSGTGNDTALRTDLAAGANALVAWIQSGAGAVLRAVRDKLRERVTVTDFGADPTGTVDSLAALNAAFALASGKKIRMPRGTYKISAALTAIVGNDISIEADEGTVILYTGANTSPGNLMTIGDGVTLYDNIRVSGLRIDSQNQLVAGFALKIAACRQVHLDVRLDGVNDQTVSKLWGGVDLSSSSLVYFHHSRITARDDGVRASNAIAVHFGHLFIKGHGTTSLNGIGTGLHYAGGCSDMNTEQINQLLNEWGCKIDNSVSANPNQQLFFDPDSAFDSNKTANILFNDATAATLSKLAKVDCWLASGAGAIVIAAWPNGRIDIGPSRMINHTSSAVYSADLTTILTVSDAAIITDNAGYAFDASGTWTIECRAQLLNNTLGEKSANVSFVSARRSQRIVQNPSLGWLLEAYDNRRTVANGANVTIAAGSGPIFVCNPSNGDMALYSVGGTNVGFVNLHGSTFVAATTTPAGGKASIAWNGVSGYNFYNNFGSSQDWYICPLVRLRPTS